MQLDLVAVRKLLDKFYNWLIFVITVDQEKNRIGSYCNIADQSEIEHQDQSPLSIPDNSFSNESCSSESYQNFDGNNI